MQSRANTVLLNKGRRVCETRALSLSFVRSLGSDVRDKVSGCVYCKARVKVRDHARQRSHIEALF